LILFNNSLTGGLPEAYGACTSLIRLRIFGNYLSGAIPAPLWGLPNLTILEIHDNNFSGAIPATIAGANNLSSIKLHNNQFSGRLPPELGQLTKLERFHAHHNKFSGAIPPEFGHLGTSLASLCLDENSFSGEVPVQIGNLRSLVYLGLSFNHLTGAIPPQIGTMEKLIFLDLSHNLLSGDLSSEIRDFDMDRFVAFNCSYNKFSGKFSAIGLIKPEWFVGNPDLCDVGGRQCQKLDGHSSKAVTKWVFIRVVPIVGSVFLITSAFVGFIIWWMGKRRRTEVRLASDGPCERQCFAPWRITTFHQVRVSYQELMECLDEGVGIGSGGCGEVYKATLRSGQEVAIKKLWEAGKGMDLHDHGFKAEVSKRHHSVLVLQFNLHMSYYNNYIFNLY
jgi:hypothetical protein